MRRRILVPIAVLVLSALATGGWFTRMHKARPANKELSTAEYEVLSSYINTKHGSFLKAKRLVMLDTTDSDESLPPLDANGRPISRSEFDASLLTKVPTLQQSTMNGFRDVNAHAARLNRASFSIEAPIIFELVDSAEIESIFNKRGDIWGDYYKRFPESQGIGTFSRVGFSADGTQALFYLSNHCGGLCGGSRYVLMVNKGGHWEIAKEIQDWVS